MKNLNDLKYKDRQVRAASLEDAYKKGYFSNSILREELMDRITKHNPQLRWHSSATHTGLFDPTKKKGFICSIGKQLTIPQFTIFKYDTAQDRVLNRSDEHGDIRHTEIINMDSDKNKVLMRSWRAILGAIKKLGYEVNDDDLA